MHFKTLFVFVVIITAAVVISSGCTSILSPEAGRIPAESSDLESAVWNLEYYMTEDGPVYVPEGVEADLECINPGLIAGSAGCNVYSTPYFLNEGEISIENVFRTDKLCLDNTRMEANPIMETEHGFLERLENVSRAYLLDGKLIFADSNGREMLVFTDSGNDPEILRPGKMAGPGDVEGYTWYLRPEPERNAIRKISANVTVTLTFGEGGRLNGFSGCKNYRADYTLKNGRLDIGEIAITQEICPAGEGLETEYNYLDRFEQVAAAYVDGDKLFLLNGMGVETLSFEKSPIQAKEWTLSLYYENEGGMVPIPEDILIDIEFRAGRAYGNSGCNNYSAQAVFDEKGNLGFGAMSITRMKCGDIMDLEKEYLELLEEAVVYSINGTSLTLYDQKGKRLLVFS